MRAGPLGTKSQFCFALALSLTGLSCWHTICFFRAGQELFLSSALFTLPSLAPQQAEQGIGQALHTSHLCFFLWEEWVLGHTQET